MEGLKLGVHSEHRAFWAKNGPFKAISRGLLELKCLVDKALRGFDPRDNSQPGVTVHNKLRSAQRRTSVIAACWARAELPF